MRLCAPLPAAPVAAQPKHSMLKLSLLVATLAQSALAAPRASTCVAYPSKCSRPDKNMTSDDQALRTQVCQQAGTEQPTGRCIPFNDAGAPGGNFTCSCCGNALFAASQWYDASTGWPAFKTTLGPQVRRALRGAAAAAAAGAGVGGAADVSSGGGGGGGAAADAAAGGRCY